MSNIAAMKKWQNTFRVGFYKCTMTYSKTGGMDVEWDPSVPKKLSAQELAQYRSGRNALHVQIANDLGINIAIIET